MKFYVGILSPYTEVEVFNRQNKVEYKVLSNYASESDIRSAVGNYGSGQYSPWYSGYYMDRKVATDRLQEEIARTEEYLDKLKFALKVTKKKLWEEVK